MEDKACRYCGEKMKYNFAKNKMECPNCSRNADKEDFVQTRLFSEAYDF